MNSTPHHVGWRHIDLKQSPSPGAGPGEGRSHGGWEKRGTGAFGAPIFGKPCHFTAASLHRENCFRYCSATAVARVIQLDSFDQPLHSPVQLSEVTAPRQLLELARDVGEKLDRCLNGGSRTVAAHKDAHNLQHRVSDTACRELKGSASGHGHKLGRRLPYSETKYLKCSLNAFLE